MSKPKKERKPSQSEWKRWVVVRISPKRWIVAEPAYNDWEYEVTTHPFDNPSDARKVCYELNEVAIEDYSDLTHQSLLEPL